MKKLILLITLSTIFISCKKEADKFPDMPFFTEAISKEFKVEEVDTVFEYVNDTENYIFLYSTKNNQLSIHKKNGKYKTVQTLNIGRIFTIDADGTVYYIDKDVYNNEFKGIEVKPPYDTQSELEIFSFDDHLGESEIAKHYENEIKQKNLTVNSPEWDHFVNEKRNIFVKDHLLNKLKCIKKIAWDEPFYILAYNDGTKSIVNEGYYFYSDKTLVSKAKGYTIRYTNEKIPICDDHSGDFDAQKFVNKAYRLELIDKVTLDYELQGSNHIALGIVTRKLYYYTFTFKNKTIKFKSTYPVVPLQSINNEILLSEGGENYKISIK